MEKKLLVLKNCKHFFSFENDFNDNIGEIKSDKFGYVEYHHQKYGRFISFFNGSGYLETQKEISSFNNDFTISFIYKDNKIEKIDYANEKIISFNKDKIFEISTRNYKSENRFELSIKFGDGDDWVDEFGIKKKIFQNNFYYITITRNKNNYKFYINTKKVYEYNSQKNFSQKSAKLKFGISSDNKKTFENFDIKNVRIFDKELSIEEIKKIAKLDFSIGNRIIDDCDDKTIIKIIGDKKIIKDDVDCLYFNGKTRLEFFNYYNSFRTLVIYFKIENKNDNMCLFNFSKNDENSLSFYPNINGECKLFFNNKKRKKINTEIKPNKYYQLVLLRNKLYINGKLEFEYDYEFEDFNRNFVIGARRDEFEEFESYFKGFITGFSLYNYELNNLEIKNRIDKNLINR